jgi:hypothetical protein
MTPLGASWYDARCRWMVLTHAGLCADRGFRTFAPLATDPVIVAAMGEDAFWRSCEARLRTKDTDQPANHAFASHAPSDGRLVVRGDHVDPFVTLIEKFWVMVFRAIRRVSRWLDARSVERRAVLCARGSGSVADATCRGSGGA